MFSKVKKHFSDNVDLYVVGAIGVTVGVTAAVVLRKKPLSFATQFNQWLLDCERSGVRIYGLNELQANVWEQVWPQVAEAMTKASAEAVAG